MLKRTMKPNRLPTSPPWAATILFVLPSLVSTLCSIALTSPHPACVSLSVKGGFHATTTSPPLQQSAPAQVRDQMRRREGLATVTRACFLMASVTRAFFLPISNVEQHLCCCIGCQRVTTTCKATLTPAQWYSPPPELVRLASCCSPPQLGTCNVRPLAPPLPPNATISNACPLLSPHRGRASTRTGVIAPLACRQHKRPFRTRPLVEINACDDDDDNHPTFHPHGRPGIIPTRHPRHDTVHTHAFLTANTSNSDPQGPADCLLLLSPTNTSYYVPRGRSGQRRDSLA